MIIEFIGVPGSGKTYLSDKMALCLDGVYTRKMLEMESISIASILKFIFRIKLCFLLIVFSFLMNLSWNLKKTYALILGIKDILKLYMVIKTRKDECFILDEGINQRILSILFFQRTSFNQRLAKVIIQNLSDELKPDLLVIVDVDMNKSIANALNRTGGLPFRYRDLPEKMIIEKYETMYSGIEIMENAYSKDKMNIIRMSEIGFSTSQLCQLV